MKFIFDWSDSAREEKSEWRGDEMILSLEILHRECSFASARVKIFACSTEKILRKKYAKIGIQKNIDEPTELLFSGRVVSFPSGVENSYVEIELIAEPDDYQQQLHKFTRENFEKYKISDKHTLSENLIPFDDLFFSQTDFGNPTIFLEGDSKIFYWNPKDGKPALSEINRGRKNFDIDGKNILQNSMKIHLAREPYKNVNISISAGWIQHIYGFIDVFPMIARQFKFGIINSYTNVKHALEKICDNSRRKNGYSLIKCEIDEFVPTQTSGFLNCHPLTSEKFSVQGNNPKIPPREILFKRFYIKGKMILGWNYRQKRTEIADINVVNGKFPQGREKNIHIKLNALQLNQSHPYWQPYFMYQIGEKVLHDGKIFQCVSAHVSEQNFDEDKWKFIQTIPDALTDNSADSFFKTSRGKNAIKYAIQKAIALINFSSRCVEISFSIPATHCFDLTLDDQVTIHDKKFPDGKISGKIIRTKFFANAETRRLDISIACCPSGFFDEYLRKLNAYCKEIDFSVDQCCPTPADIVKEIEIRNPPEFQEKILHETPAEKVEDLIYALRHHVTKIKISLHPINVVREIVNKIHLKDFHL